MGSRVGSSGIQLVTQFRKCTFRLRVSASSGWDPEWDPVGSSLLQFRACAFRLRVFTFSKWDPVGSSMSLFRKCRVCSRRRSGSMVGQIFLAFWSMTKPATWSHQCTTGCKETLQRHCDRVGSEVGLAPKQNLLNGRYATLGLTQFVLQGLTALQKIVASRREGVSINARRPSGQPLRIARAVT